jgi:hypothetical protein
MKKRIRLFASALAATSALLAVQRTVSAADIYGTITFNGTPPHEIDIIPLKDDPNCGPLHKEIPTTHFYVVEPNGGLGDAVVSIKGVQAKSTGAGALLS